MSTVRFGVLGPLRVRRDGEEVTPRGALQRRLLCALLLRANATVSTDALADTLWPHGLPADHQAALQTHVFRLRRLLPDGAIGSDPSGYRLHVGDGDVDAARFEVGVYRAAGRRGRDPGGALAMLDEVLGLWCGAPYEELADVEDARIEAARLAELRVRGGEERIDCLLDLDRHAEVIADLEALAAHHPLRERLQGQLMLALERDGRRADALAVFERYRRSLATELGIDPSPSLRQLHDRIVIGEAPEPATPRAAPAPPALPDIVRYSSSFLGRGPLVAEVADLLERERLVTLLGTGGVGKTRIASEVCSIAGDRFGTAVWFCELAAADPATVILSVAASMGIEERAGVDHLGRIADVLRIQRGLMVLDNCEHVLDGAAEVAEAVLAGAPGTRVLATSRERLAVDGEHLYPVPPLPRPGKAGLEEPAVRLFVDRATAVRPGWQPDEEELAVVAEVCRRLDGLPLAIELAAARLHTLTLSEVAAGLETRFRLLTGGRRTTARHRSLAAAVSWSYDLLNPREQAMFEVIALFQSPFGASGAAAMLRCGDAEAAELLSILVERSLVHRVGTRYGLLESLRQFGCERLEERGTIVALRERHARHHLDLAENSNSLLRRPGSTGVLDDLDASLSDLRVAQRLLSQRGDNDDRLRFAVALRDYGFFRMRPEVLGWAEDAAARAEVDGLVDPRIGDAYAIASLEAWNRGRHARGTELATLAHRAMEAAGQPAYYVLETLGHHALIRGDLPAALAWHEAALATEAAQVDEMKRLESHGSRVLARAYAGDPGTAADVDALLASLSDASPTVAASWAWYAAGESVVHTDPMLAAERLQRAIDLGTRSGAPFLTGIAGATAASIEARHGDPVLAVRQYRQLLSHWQRAGVVVLQWNMLRAVAELLVRTGCLRHAGMLLGAITSSEAGHQVFGDDATRVAAVEKAVRDGLGPEPAAAALAEGRTLNDDEAVAVALAAFDQLS